MGWTPLFITASSVPKWLSSKPLHRRGASAMNTTTIGLDIAKAVFQVHGIDARGQTTLRKRLRRAQLVSFFANLPACLVGIEACGSAHHWARELCKLGHEVQLMSPPFVGPS